jgi:hypothetical protein
MMATPRPVGGTAHSQAQRRALAEGLPRIVGAWLLLVAVGAFGLRVVDAVPRVALGIPRGVVRVSDVGQLDRESGRRMPVPAYFPDTIQWPPTVARFHTSGSAAIWCRQRPAGGVVLILATAPRGTRDISSAVLPASVELQREAAMLGTRPAVVSRVRDADGAVWQQVQWQTADQIVLVRYRGTLDELLKIAGSVHE